VPADHDRRLIARCLAGDREAWEGLWRQHAPYVSAALRSWAAARGGIPAATVEDLCQELFLQLWRDRDSVLRAFRGRSSLGHYLAVIAIRRAMRVRKGDAALPKGLQDPRPVPDSLEAEERAAALQQACLELAPRERLLIQLVYIEDLAPSVAAGLLQLDPGHARVLLHRAREHIRTTLDRQGFSP
jgi:RNA polymerase sigma-70 factor (ECF subfamily)